MEMGREGGGDGREGGRWILKEGETEKAERNEDKEIKRLRIIQ
jgi:hypothetical protein